jgi:hypothetical protein
MVSLPGACSKAIFDMVWDLYRNAKSSQDQTAERPRGAEDGIEMHHVNSEQSSQKQRSKDGKETSLTRRARRTQSSDGLQEENPYPGNPRSSTPEIISLLEYCTESFNETKLQSVLNLFVSTFPTLSATLRRLPYALLPFAFSQFILVEALSYTGWINVFSNWLAIVVGFSIPATVFVVGVLSVILCNVSGTNIGATILLVKILRHPNFANRQGLPTKVETAGMLALAVGSNIGAVSFTFSASLAGITLYLSTEFRSIMANNPKTERDYSEGWGICQMECASITIYDSGWMCCGSCRGDSRTDVT